MYFREPENKEEADRTAWDYYMYAGQIPKEVINRHTSKFLYKNPTAQRYATLGGAVSALLAGGLGAIVGSKFNRPGSGSIIGSLAGALGGGILGYRYGLKKDDEDRLNSYREWYNIQQEGDPSKAFPLLDPKELPHPDVFKQASVSNLNKISTQMNKKAFIKQTVRKQIIKQAFKLDDIKKWWKSLNSAKRDAIIGGGVGALGGGLLGGAVRGWRGAGLGALGGGALGTSIGYGHGLSTELKLRNNKIKGLNSDLKSIKDKVDNLRRRNRYLSNRLTSKEPIITYNKSNNNIDTTTVPADSGASPVVSNSVLGISIGGPSIPGLRQAEPNKITSVIDLVPKGNLSRWIQHDYSFENAPRDSL